MTQIAKFTAAAAALMLPLGVGSAGQSNFLDGSYEVVSRLEIPHVERWAIDKISEICLAGIPANDSLPIPVLSTNNPFGKCTVRNVAAAGAALDYDIVCPGHGAAKAHASYKLSEDGFSGRVAMVMGGKNMTMTEVVRARRTGACEGQKLKSAERF